MHRNDLSYVSIERHKGEKNIEIKLYGKNVLTLEESFSSI